MNPIIHLHLVLMLRMSGDIPLRPVHAFYGVYGDTFAFFRKNNTLSFCYIP